ncbi:MAG: hypothetical protein KGQ37_03660 [Hyphomicrobiales bacterium]|nr:hypothetical protein [Hyphomicrobiales bacterium]
MTVLDAPALAQLLALRNVAALHRRLPLLLALGFPRPLPGLGLRWSAAQVEDWVAAGGPGNAPPPRPPRGLALVVDNARSRLDARYP